MNSERGAQRLLLPIAILAFILFTYGNTFDLPHFSHWDEKWLVEASLSPFRTRSWGISDIRYGVLLHYLYLIGYGIVYAAGVARGAYSSIKDIPLPTFLRSARFMSALSGIVGVWGVYRTGTMAGDRRTGIVSAFLLSTNFYFAQYSHYATGDVLSSALVITTAYFAMRCLESGRIRDWAVAGISLGLTFCVKYNFLVVFAILAAAFANREGPKRLRAFMPLIVAGGATVLTVTALNGIIVRDIPAAIRSFIWIIGAQRQPHDGFFGHRNWLYYIRVILSPQGFGIALSVLALLGIVVLIIKKPAKALLLAVFPVAYYCYLASAVLKQAGYILPLIPFLVLFASVGLVAACDMAASRLPRFFSNLLIASLAVVLAIPSLTRIVIFDSIISRTNTRADATRWIEARIPRGSIILMNDDPVYEPYLGAGRYRVVKKYLPELRDIGNAEYVVASSGAYLRYFLEPELNPTGHRTYSRIFRRMECMKEFREPTFASGYFSSLPSSMVNLIHNPTIRIYKVPEGLPSNFLDPEAPGND